MPFAGFDRSDYPGDAIMQTLLNTTNLRWCGYYLAPAPSHPGTSWMGNRAKLVAMGWGLAPLYVGEQVVPPGSQHSSAVKGTQDGADAVALMQGEGFAPGSFVYLDLENGPPYQPPQSDYVNSWCAAVAAANYGAGVYCSHLFGAQLQATQPAVRIWAIRVSTTAAHPVPGPNYPDPDPATFSGVPTAQLLQLHQNCQTQITSVAKVFTLDLDSAVMADPSV